MAQDDRQPRLIRSTPRLTREEIVNQSFPQSFRGVSEAAVRAFLRRLADEYEALRVRQDELFAELERLEAAAGEASPPEEQDLIGAVGEETARVLRSAKESADEIRKTAEEKAADLLKEAHDEARSVVEQAEQLAAERTKEADEGSAEMLREAERLARELQEGAEARAAEFETQAEAEARSELESARRRSKELVGEAQATRDRMLQELGRRRDALETQLEGLRVGRDRLLEAYRTVKRTLDEATEALRSVEARGGNEGKRPRVSSAALPPQHGFPEADDRAEEAPDPEDAVAPAASDAGADVEPSEESASADVPSTTPPPPARVSSFALGELDSAPAPQAAPEPKREPEPEPQPEPERDEPSAAEAPAPEAGSDADKRQDVDEIFARLKAEAPDTDDTEHIEGAPASDSSGASPPGSEPEPAAATRDEAVEVSALAAHLLTQRREALEPLVDTLVRAVKRVVRDEQNLVLEAVRTHRGAPSADAVLPSVQDQDEAFADATLEVLAEAALAGERVAHDLGVAGGLNGDNSRREARARELAVELARDLMDPLRGKLGDALREVEGGDHGDMAERVRARYRDWKSQRIDASARNSLAAAFARGLYDAVPDGVALRWVTTDAAPCPDCADNSLESTARGRAFPTGHLVPPAHAGCHCVVLPADVSAAVEVG